jgi:hypothetical protein
MLDTQPAGSANLSASTSSPETEPQLGAVEHAVHACDADCHPHLDAEGIECTVCGVSWGDCYTCGGHAFHADGCAEAL